MRPPKRKPLADPTPAMLELAGELFPDATERARFLEALIGGFGEEQAIVVLRPAIPIQTFPKIKPEPWQPDFVHRIQGDFRAGTHALHDSGHFYCMDSSSVFAASGMGQIPLAPRRVLDMCSAPGGKSIYAFRQFVDAPAEELIANDVNRRRTGALMLNLERCRVENAKVTVHDPNWFARVCPEAFDLVIVDAPCSGQSLLAKGTEGPSCFEKKLVAMNASRQKRIIANAARCVAPGGHLLYMTCTFAQEENEHVIDWLIESFPEFQSVEFGPGTDQYLSNFGKGYRIYPHLGLGAGAYSCLLRRDGDCQELPPLPELQEIWKFGDAPRTPRNTASAPIQKSSKNLPKKQFPRRPRR